MRLAVTGFVSEAAGSVASANGLLIKGLLARGHEIDFFSKASFVDPRPVVGPHPRFRFHNTDNHFADRLRFHTSKMSGINLITRLFDTKSYHRLLVQRIRDEHRTQNFDLAIWLGDYARGRVPSLPNVSFAQGAPGSDARSIIHHRDELIRLSGRLTYAKWQALAHARLSRFGLPNFRWSDLILVGSSISKRILVERYHVSPDRIVPLPYPIDLDSFRPPPEQGANRSPRVSETTVQNEFVYRSEISAKSSNLRPPRNQLRILWLGRIVPRKRLDLFIAAAERAIQSGVDLSLTVVGSVGFFPGLESYLRDFAYPSRLTWIPKVTRSNVPLLMWDHDVLCQPSDEENFGSSVAEAQACGLPVIVGSTNGNRDYLCQRDIQLKDDSISGLADALAEMLKRKGRVRDGSGPATLSHSFATRTFSIDTILSQFEQNLRFALTLD